jgi:hypothetical protein
MTEPEHLSGRHRDTLRQLFEHPVSHNVEWRAVLSLLGEVGSVTTHHNGKIAVTVGPRTEFFDPRGEKDLDAQTVVDVRELLASAGYRSEDGSPD